VRAAQARLAAWLAVAVVAGGAGACADTLGGADVDAGAAPVPACELGQPGASGFEGLDEGGDVELTRGIQGYLLVFAALRAHGASPRKTHVALRAARDGDAPLQTQRPGLAWTPGADGATSEPFEIWLAPPVITEFVGRTGWIEARVGPEAAPLCVVRRAVRFVDREVCMHYEDGTLDCERRKQGGGAADGGRAGP
jgi:hypothetical protein